ncbi:hypothetical protein N8I77_008689 [Diaporthe amygdali]|uniref:AB hydrolase-1 domain-containing protein n=1 Tax=Phomopsis amygdali TaxID=1214568 RepID=A0AAD9S9E3_PHOAM|nr:hypothetical protein N8I77_008689 [Diaporthe amygdali]
MIFTSSSPLRAALVLAGLSSARKCIDLSIDVPVVSRNAVFNQTTPTTDIEVTNFALDLTRQGHNRTNEVLTGYANIKKTYTVAATYCEPDSGPSKTLQLLTHGIGFDRTYWDLSINDYNYSYVAVANDDYGYSTFAWDRLGIAQSQHGEAVNEIQSSLEIAALYTLTKQLREGSIDGISCGFDKVVHVGHSFGSIQSYSLAVLHPGASDGLILTGFSQASQFVPYFALGANFVAANGLPPFLTYPDGYLASSDPSGVQTDFFSPGAFDPALLDLATASGKPVTVGELLTISAATAMKNPLKGPVLIITGGRDIPFCGGDCLLTGSSLPNFLEMSKPMFPSASKFEAIVVGEAGHGLNLEYSHPFTYGKILDFVTQNVGL